MANHPSAVRRNRQRIRRAARNRSVISAMRTNVKKARAAVAENPAQALETLRQVEASLDKAATKGVIHKRTAARAKARLYNRLNKANAEAQKG